MEKDKQLDLFEDFRKQAEIMHSIGGVFIGRFTDDALMRRIAPLYSV